MHMEGPLRGDGGRNRELARDSGAVDKLSGAGTSRLGYPDGGQNGVPVLRASRGALELVVSQYSLANALSAIVRRRRGQSVVGQVLERVSTTGEQIKCNTP